MPALWNIPLYTHRSPHYWLLWRRRRGSWHCWWQLSHLSTVSLDVHRGVFPGAGTAGDRQLSHLSTVSLGSHHWFIPTGTPWVWRTSLHPHPLSHKSVWAWCLSHSYRQCSPGCLGKGLPQPPSHTCSENRSWSGTEHELEKKAGVTLMLSHDITFVPPYEGHQANCVILTGDKIFFIL